MIDKDTAIEVTQELTRRCYPCGDTSVDEQRYESLLVKIAVASSLIDEIYEAGKLYDRHEYSITHISVRAKEYLTELRDMLCEIEYLPPVEDMGEVSDGYHTFNQLYHQRAVLFATIVNQNKDKAWKSWKHEDGQFCFGKGGEWFIVGIDTPEGSYTYHYEQKYWDMFDCEELERGKHWDGHTEDDVTRLLSLPPVEPKRPQGEWIEYIDDRNGRRYGKCPSCNKSTLNAIEYDVLDGERYIMDFCPKCGADMRGNDYQRHIEDLEHFMRYETTYNPEDGSM